MHGIRASVVTTVVYEMSQRGNRIVCIAKLLSNKIKVERLQKI